MDLETLKLLGGLGATGILAVALFMQDKRQQRLQASLDRMIERLARIDVRTAGAEAVPEPIRPERSRRIRKRTPVPTPFVGGEEENDR